MSNKKMNMKKSFLSAKNTYVSSDKEETSVIHPEDITDFPGYSHYIKKRMCGIKYVYFPDLNKYFIGHWLVLPKFPIGVFTLSVSSYFVLFFFTMQFFNSPESVIVLAISFILLCLFLICFVMIIVVGPGYYPFSLLQDNGYPPTQWNGIQTTQRQYMWVKVQGRPPRSTFSIAAHRYVIRPDHFCDWAASWIGKRNFKSFILFNFYGMLYLSLFSIYIIRTLIILCTDLTNTKFIVIAIIYTILGCGFTLYTGHFFVQSVIHSIQNITNYEIWHGYDASCFNQGNWLANMRDVFGQDSIWMWFCPSSPFKGQSNTAISINYISYDLVSFPSVGPNYH